MIFAEGEAVHGIYFINSGSAKVHKKWGVDKELIVRFARQGAILGHRGMGANPIYPASAHALEPCTVCYIDVDFFNSTLKVNNQFTFKLLMFFAEELRESERKMRNLAHMSVKGRIAQGLITLKEQFGLSEDGAVGIDLTRQDLASFAGATYETVFRVMNEMVAEGILLLSGKTIKVLDETALLKLTEMQGIKNL